MAQQLHLLKLDIKIPFFPFALHIYQLDFLSEERCSSDTPHIFVRTWK